MSLNALQLKILAPFVEETIRCLDIMAGLKATAGEPFVDELEKFRFKGYAVAAETHGKINGVILMHHYIETALGVGNEVRAHLLGEQSDASVMDDEVGEALAEWGNTAIGRATRDLEIFDMGIKFCPPYFVNNTEDIASLMTGVKEIISIPIHVEGVGRFYFNYLLHSETRRHRTMIPMEDKIMIVDDMKMIRTSLRRYLKTLGYENIVEAANGREAVLKHTMENPAIIFMDVVMPELTGTEALARIRATDTHTPVVMLSSVADNDVIQQCEQQGIAGYLIKPLTMENGPETMKEFLMKAS